MRDWSEWTLDPECPGAAAPTPTPGCPAAPAKQSSQRVPRTAAEPRGRVPGPGKRLLGVQGDPGGLPSGLTDGVKRMCRPCLVHPQPSSPSGPPSRGAQGASLVCPSRTTVPAGLDCFLENACLCEMLGLSHAGGRWSFLTLWRGGAPPPASPGAGLAFPPWVGMAGGHRGRGQGPRQGPSPLIVLPLTLTTGG